MASLDVSHTPAFFNALQFDSLSLQVAKTEQSNFAEKGYDVQVEVYLSWDAF